MKVMRGPFCSMDEAVRKRDNNGMKLPVAFGARSLCRALATHALVRPALPYRRMLMYILADCHSRGHP